MTANNTTLKLQVLICTLGREGMQHVAEMNLPRVAGTGWIISCQSEPAVIPPQLLRDDIEVYFTPTRGLSKNRNHALSKARASYCLIADDDLIFTNEGLEAVIRSMDARPEVDVATFRCDFPFKKDYPDSETDLPASARGYYVTSYEIALRLESARRAGLRFCEIMGIGADRFQSGEEYILMRDAQKAGLHCHFFPVTIVCHPGIPTGRRLSPGKGAIEADGVVIALEYKLTLLPRLLLKAFRTGGNPLRNFHYLLQGAVYALRHKELFTGF